MPVPEQSAAAPAAGDAVAAARHAAPAAGAAAPGADPAGTAPVDGGTPRPARRSRASAALKVGGLVIAVAAIAICAKELVDQWGEIHESLVHANLGLIVVGLLAAGASMVGLGVLWWRCLIVFGAPVRLTAAVSWYFGGELGKYVPGGVWPVLGRGELARRAGVPRVTGYVTTLVSYAAMCVAAAVVCGALAPAIAAHSASLSWGWLMIALIPIGLAAVHPAVLGRVLALGNRLTKGRVPLTAPGWGTMLRLIGWSLPTWVLAGAAYVAVTAALGYHQNVAQVAFAAIAAWILGFLAVPVPAGVGVREVVFVAASGLAGGPAVAVAAIARLLYIVVDAAGGLSGLAAARRTGLTAIDPDPVPADPDLVPSEPTSTAPASTAKHREQR